MIKAEYSEEIPVISPNNSKISRKISKKILKNLALDGEVFPKFTEGDFGYISPFTMFDHMWSSHLCY